METKSRSLLIIFYRNPELGRVKTRLATTIGEQRALDIYLKLSDHAKSVAEKIDVDKIVFYSDFIPDKDFWDERVFQKRLQIGNDLGEKMNNAFAESFHKGYKSICIIGTDCFELTTDILDEAFKKLLYNDAVIGPTKDGGYYLLGLNKLYPELFTEKKWSTDTVAEDTIKDFYRLGLKFSQLQKLRDIDIEADLPTELRGS